MSKKKFYGVSRLTLVVSVASLAAPFGARADFTTPPTTTAQTVQNNDVGTIDAGATLAPGGVFAIQWNGGATLPGVIINNNGTLGNAATTRAIDTSATANGNFTLNNNGTLISGNDAFRLNLNGATGLAFAGTVKVNNSGLLTSQTGQALDFASLNSVNAIIQIINATSGTIRGLANDAIAIGSGAVSITNSGIIDGSAATRRAIDLNAATLNNVSSFSVVNNAGATIQSSDDTIRATGSAGLTTTTGTFSIDNSGTIASLGTGANAGQAIDFNNINSNAATVTITNRAGGMIMTADADAVRPGQVGIVNNFGTINAGAVAVPGDQPSNDGVDFQDGHTGGSVHNFSTGVITGARHGITGGTTSTVSVMNDAGGTITGRNGSGVGLDGTGTVTNAGTITGTIDSTSLRGDGDGVDIDGIATITNSGTIQGLGAKGNDSGGRTNAGEGISIGGGTITNSGTIRASSMGLTGTNLGGGGGAIVVNNDANIDRSGTGATTITNNIGGTIVSDTSFAIRLENKSTATPAINNDTITNYGTIIGNGAIPDQNAVVTFVNPVGGATQPDPNSVGTLNGVAYTGTGSARFIRGDGAAIQMGEGNDVLSNYGTITGNSGRAISLEGGDDTLNLYGGSVVNGSIDGGVGTDTINLAGTGSGTLQNVLNFETLSVQGGVWTIPDTQTYATGITISGGTLRVNGSLAGSGNVAVNNGGTLGGTGTVPTTVIASGGTLAPGNSIGTLAVAGNLTFNRGSTYAVEVSPTASDRTNVTGTAALAGTVNASVTGGGSSRPYTILSANGGRVGTFDAVTTGMPGFSASLSYTPTDALLSLTAQLGIGTPLPANAQNVSTALNTFFNTGGTLPAQFVTLFGLTGQNLVNALNQTDGQTATGAQQSAFQTAGQFLGLMLDPFAGQAGGGTDANARAIGFAPENKGSRVAEAAYAAMPVKAKPMTFVEVSRWNVWGAGFGGSQITRGEASAGSADTTSRIGGFAAGADYRLAPRTTVGFALAGAGTSWGLSGGLGGGRADVFQAGIYGTHHFGAAYVAAALSYAWYDTTTDRTLGIAGTDVLRARFDAHSFGGRIETGYRYDLLSYGLTPYAAFQGISVHTPSYGESAVSGAGAFALNYASQSAASTRSELGAGLDRTTVLDSGNTVTWRLRTAWAHEFDRDRRINATFQSLPGASFTVDGARPSNDSALVSASADLGLGRGWSVGAKFDGEFSGRTESYAGTGRVKYAW